MNEFVFNSLFSAVAPNWLRESALLTTVLNMSMTASVIIVFVLLVRLMLKRAPKIFSYALWAVVLFRLLCPVSVTTDLSLLGLLDTPVQDRTEHTTVVEYIPHSIVRTPDSEVQKPTAPAIGDTANVVMPPVQVSLSEAPTEGTMSVAAAVWLTGIAVMAVYGAVSYLRLRRRLIGSVILQDNIYLTDYITSPFVMGLLRPKIYLPSSLSEKEQAYIILHEQCHIRRLDHIIKGLAFAALCIHWFNPLVWVSFILSSKDMEMSCDEAVVKKLGEGIRADYSASLLSLATGRRIFAGMPLAFGEGDTKGRIKNMLNWKKPKAWIILVAAIVCAAVIIFCAANPQSDEKNQPNATVVISWEVEKEYPDAVITYVNSYVEQQIEYYNGVGSKANATSGEYSIVDAKVVGLTEINTSTAALDHSISLFLLEYRLLPSDPSHVALVGGMQMEDDWITEWGSVGQPYLAMLCEGSRGEAAWEFLGVTNTDSIMFDYGTEEMLSAYGDAYTAAAFELYKKYLASVKPENQGLYGSAEDVSYYLELAAGTEFQNMTLEKQIGLLVEYEDLLDDYTLIARETTDGKSSYIVGSYNGDNLESSPLYGMYGTEIHTGEDDYYQLLYREADAASVEDAMAKQQIPYVGYRIEDSQLFFPNSTGLILIQPKDTELSLDVVFNRYLYTPNGREYIADAVSRGIDMCSRTEPFLYVYRISERFGEIAERITLTAAEAAAILAEERVTITEGFGFSATLHVDGETTYYNEREGIPQTVLDLAVERCDYRFGDPSYITDTIREARLDCDWLDTPLYAGEEALPRLREILKNAEHGYVGACGYGAKLTLTFTGGEKLTVFKGTDNCDSMVFGSYGGYFIGDQENTEFWKMFGLDPNTKEPLP